MISRYVELEAILYRYNCPIYHLSIQVPCFRPRPFCSRCQLFNSPTTTTGRGDDLAVEPMSRNPEGRGSIPRLGSRRSSLISIEHAELRRSTPSFVLCCAWLVTMALRLGPTQPITDFWGWQMSSSEALRTGKAEQNKRHPPVAVKLRFPLYK